MNSNQILSIYAVMAAMTNYAEASASETKARNAYNGYSWGWVGQDYIEATEKAKEAAESVLEQYIEACVEKALQKREQR